MKRRPPPGLQRLPLATAEALAATLGLPTQLAARAAIEPNSGCVLWLGATNKGHGRIVVAVDVGATRLRVWWYTHVLAWTHVHGPVAPGVVLDHVCRNRACMNVAHLEPVSSRENTLRGHGPTAVNARRETCGGCGGAYDPPSTGVRAGRRCKRCRRERARERKQRRQQHGTKADRLDTGARADARDDVGC